MTNIPNDWGKTIIEEFEQELLALRERNAMYRNLYDDKLIGCIVIRDRHSVGPMIAWSSGFEHRMSAAHRAFNLCNSPTLQFVDSRMSYSPFQTVPMSIAEAKREIKEYSYLGCDVTPLFEHFEVKYPERALFLYPENFVVPNQERQIVDLILKRPETSRVFIITKSPLIISDMMDEAVWILAHEGERIIE